MGATNIGILLPNKATPAEIEKAFRDRQTRDRACNGHQEGYSGDFQTVDSVKFCLDKVFPNYTKAEEYCMENAEKWEYVVAVYFLDKGEFDGVTRTLIAGLGAE